MPNISLPNYDPVWYLRNPDFTMIYGARLRPVRVAYKRHTITTPDHDFLDIDLHTPGESDHLVLLLHGLEGSSRATYCKGMAQAMGKNGFHVAALNFRGCSGRPNRQLFSYLAGSTQDLAFVVDYLKQSFPSYTNLFVVGVSLGGNVLLKYLGEQGASLKGKIQAAVALSSGCDIEGICMRLSSFRNRLYQGVFLHGLKNKIMQKMNMLPDFLNVKQILNARTVAHFDMLFTAPANGFESAQEYWKQQSALPWLACIQVPTLIVNALDDPFFTPLCYPYQIADESKFLHLLTPKYGGHMGFIGSRSQGMYWHEATTMSFFRNAL